MKIAIVVQGRFHAFELARALLARGHDVTVFTNIPAALAPRFGLKPSQLRSFALHGVVSRLARAQKHEPWLSRWFGRWAARRVWQQRWDLVHVFAGAGEELLRARPNRGEVIDVMRPCSHMRTQDQLMAQEAQRTGARVGRPLPWTMQREEREYALADRVVVLSRFAAQSFEDHGFAPSRIVNNPLAAELPLFAADAKDVAARAQRVRSGRPLRLLFVGALSYRKGSFDLLHIAQALDPARFELRAVGDISISPEHLQALSQRAECTGRLPYANLPQTFAWGDVYVFPTIEDGFAVVLAQAMATGLPALATTNCGAPDLIDEGGNGWVLPIRAPQAFVERLQTLERDREALARMIESIPKKYPPRSWDDVARELIDSVPAR